MEEIKQTLRDPETGVLVTDPAQIGQEKEIFKKLEIKEKKEVKDGKQ